MIKFLTESMKLRYLVLAGALLAPLGLTACNTVEGMGEDLEESSENVEEEIEE